MSFGIDPIGAGGAAGYDPNSDDVGSEGTSGNPENPVDSFTPSQDNALLTSILNLGRLRVFSLFGNFFSGPSTKEEKQLNEDRQMCRELLPWYNVPFEQYVGNLDNCVQSRQLGRGMMGEKILKLKQALQDQIDKVCR